METEDCHSCYRNSYCIANKNMEGNTRDATSSLIKAHTEYYGSITGRTLGKGMVAIHAIGSLGNFNKKRCHGQEWHRGQGGMEQPAERFC